MPFSNFKHLLLKVHIGYRAAQSFQKLYLDYSTQKAKDLGLSPNSAKATARLAIQALILRIQKDERTQTWEENDIKNNLLEHIDQQLILKKIRQTGHLVYLPVSINEYIQKQCHFYTATEYKKLKDTGYSESLVLDMIADQAISQVYEIFLKNIQDTHFQLKSSITTYIDGIARIVVKSIFRKLAYPAIARQTSMIFKWEKILSSDTRSKLFSLLESLIGQIERKQCRDLLLKSFRLFNMVTDHEKIHYEELRQLKNAIVNQIGEVVGFEENKRIDKAYQHCYQRFIIDSYPVVYKEFKGDFPYSLEYIKAEVKKCKEKIEKEKASKRISKQKAKEKFFT
jgi:hypothetical protein